MPRLCLTEFAGLCERIVALVNYSLELRRHVDKLLLQVAHLRLKALRLVLFSGEHCFQRLDAVIVRHGCTTPAAVSIQARSLAFQRTLRRGVGASCVLDEQERESVCIQKGCRALLEFGGRPKRASSLCRQLCRRAGPLGLMAGISMIRPASEHLMRARPTMLQRDIVAVRVHLALHVGPRNGRGPGLLRNTCGCSTCSIRKILNTASGSSDQIVGRRHVPASRCCNLLARAVNCFNFRLAVLECRITCPHLSFQDCSSGLNTRRTTWQHSNDSERGLNAIWGESALAFPSALN